MSESSRQSTPTPTSEPESLSMQDIFHRKVLSFISSSSAPQWYEFFDLIDQLTRIVSTQYPATRVYYKDFLLKFVYQETSLPQFQSDLAYLLAHEPLLYDYFSAFLKLKSTSSAQCNAARQYFCTLTGLPADVSPSSSSPRQRPSMKEIEKFNEKVSQRFAAYPGKLRDYLLLNLRRWREGQSHETREEIIDLLADEGDLLEFFERLWPAGRGRGL